MMSCNQSSKKNYDKTSNVLNQAKLDSIANVLDIVYVDDQHLRQQYQEIKNEFGYESKEVKAFWVEQNNLDSINLKKVTSIIDQYGWLGIDEVGTEANSALFLVIQHSELDTQIRYLPILKEAVDNGKASKIDYAMLNDRILVRKGEKQIYGTQLIWDHKMQEYYVASVVDPENLNERRASIGLDPIEEHIAPLGLEWDLAKYKKRIERIESEKK
jgi:uncharacterized protein (UPF0335 family)